MKSYRIILTGGYETKTLSNVRDFLLDAIRQVALKSGPVLLANPEREAALRIFHNLEAGARETWKREATKNASHPMQSYAFRQLIEDTKSGALEDMKELISSLVNLLVEI